MERGREGGWATHFTTLGPLVNIPTVRLQLEYLSRDVGEVMLERREETSEGIEERRA